MIKRVIELLRVSTDAQDVARQRSDLARLRKKFDLESVRTLELVGVSGTATLTHADVQRVLADLKRRDVDGVGVSALDWSGPASVTDSLRFSIISWIRAR